MAEEPEYKLPSEEELSKTRIIAKAAFQKFEPFLAQFAATRELVVTPGRICCTDGKRVTLGYDLVKNYPRGHVFAFSHEIWHIALNHLPRFKNLSPDRKGHALYNILTDAKINDIVKQSINLSSREWEAYKNDIVSQSSIEKFLNQVLEGDWKAAYDDSKDADTQFRALYPFLQKGDKNGGGSGSIEGILEELGELGKSLTEEQRQQIEREVSKSIANAKIRGTQGGSMLSELQEIWCEPVVPWRQILANAIRSRLGDSRSWSKFNRRSMF